MQPDFRTLLEVDGHPEIRWVGSMVMDEEQYHMEQWSFQDGYWAARLAGLQAYGRLIAERKAEKKRAWITRRESDDEWSSHVASLIERESE